MCWQWIERCSLSNVAHTACVTLAHLHIIWDTDKLFPPRHLEGGKCTICLVYKDNIFKNKTKFIQKVDFNSGKNSTCRCI